MEKQRPRFRLEELDLQTKRDARVYRQHSLRPDPSVNSERSHPPCEVIGCDCNTYDPLPSCSCVDDYCPGHSGF